MKLPMIHHPGYTIDLPASHPFPMRKFQVLREQLAASPFDQAADWWQPAPADRAMLLHAHTTEYVDAGSGYCLVNDIAIAARHAVTNGWARRVLIVDLDVHQGDGTAAICKDDPTVFTFSMHAGSNFPARKHPGDLDIAPDKGTGDTEYLNRLQRTLPKLLTDFRPDLVIYDAGVDVHALDRLGHLELTDDGVLQRDRTVLETCRNNGTPVAAVIGGGYDRDMDALARRHGLLFQAAVGLQGGRG